MSLYGLRHFGTNDDLSKWKHRNTHQLHSPLFTFFFTYDQTDISILYVIYILIFTVCSSKQNMYCAQFKRNKFLH